MEETVDLPVAIEPVRPRRSISAGLGLQLVGVMEMERRWKKRLKRGMKMDADAPSGVSVGELGSRLGADDSLGLKSSELEPRVTN
jgi:hypothetical protein